MAMTKIRNSKPVLVIEYWNTPMHLNPYRLGLEGWYIPEAAYVASLCLLKETTLPN